MHEASNFNDKLKNKDDSSNKYLLEIQYYFYTI